MRATSLAAFLAAARETFARGDGPGARRTLALLDDLEIPASTRVPTPGEPPGEVIEVPSMTPHALRTGARALLMLWSWTGDITFDRYRFTS